MVRKGVPVLDTARGGTPDMGALERRGLMDKMERIPSPGTQVIPLWSRAPSA